MNTENPLGTNGFGFVEFSAKDPAMLQQYFVNMGFNKVGNHKALAIELYRQNDIYFLLNQQPDSHAADFVTEHGAAAVSMAFRVSNATQAQKIALEKGAKPYNKESTIDLPCVQGVGGSLLYFISDNDYQTFFSEQFELNHFDVEQSFGLTYIDHLTHNVEQGQMDVWAEFYERIFNFKEVRYFDIKGQQTGLLSRAMTSPCGKIRIPINESKDDKSQIVEFIQEFNGEGIQHIALATEDIYTSISKMRDAGIHFLKTPDVYFEMIQDRLPWQQEPVAKLQQLQILIDGGKTEEEGLLLQIFTENMLGPVFFEIIQRKGNQGFGEGNFQALFEAIERDQISRGKL